MQVIILGKLGKKNTVFPFLPSRLQLALEWIEPYACLDTGGLAKEFHTSAAQSECCALLSLAVQLLAQPACLQGTAKFSFMCSLCSSVLLKLQTAVNPAFEAVSFLHGLLK